MPTTASNPLDTALRTRDLNGILRALLRQPLKISVRGKKTTLFLDEEVFAGIGLLVNSGTVPFVQQGLDIARHIIYDGVFHNGIETTFADNHLIHPDRMLLIGRYVEDWVDFHPSEAVRSKELRRVINVFFGKTHYASVVRSAADKLQEIEQKKKAAHQRAANMAVFKPPVVLRMAARARARRSRNFRRLFFGKMSIP